MNRMLRAASRLLIALTTFNMLILVTGLWFSTKAIRANADLYRNNVSDLIMFEKMALTFYPKALETLTTFVILGMLIVIAMMIQFHRLAVRKHHLWFSALAVVIVLNFGGGLALTIGRVLIDSYNPTFWSETIPKNVSNEPNVIEEIAETDIAGEMVVVGFAEVLGVSLSPFLGMQGYEIAGGAAALLLPMSPLLEVAGSMIVYLALLSWLLIAIVPIALTSRTILARFRTRPAA